MTPLPEQNAGETAAEDLGLQHDRQPKDRAADSIGAVGPITVDADNARRAAQPKRPPTDGGVLRRHRNEAQDQFSKTHRLRTETVRPVTADIESGGADRLGAGGAQELDSPAR